MKHENHFIEKFYSIYMNVCNLYLSLPDEKKIWQLAERGFLFELFQLHGNDGSHLNIFFKKIDDVIQKRLEVDYSLPLGAEIDGRLLSFDASATMYDGVAQDASFGFFDSDDVPPPEFWIGVEDGLLISFVPLHFFDSANIGVTNCLSGSLEWIG